MLLKPGMGYSFDVPKIVSRVVIGVILTVLT